MKIVFISDLQACDWNSYPERNEEGQHLRLLDTVNELSRIRNLCLRNGAGMLCVLGDIFEARSLISIEALNAVYNAFMEFHQAGIKVVLLVGNHDRTSVGKEHALQVFKSFAMVIDKPTMIPLEEGNIVGIPFHPHTFHIEKAIEKYVTEETKLLLLHCAVTDTRTPFKGGISLDAIPEHVTCLLGHYHKWTELRRGKVWYLGSMIPVDFGDTDSEKFYAIYNTQRGNIQFHHTVGPKFVSLKLSLKDASKVSTGSQMVPSDLNLQDYLPVIAGNFIKVTQLPAGFTDFHGLRQVLLSLDARHVNMSIETMMQDTPQQEATEDDPWYDNVEEVIEDYVEATPTNLNKEQLVEEATSIVGEAKQPPSLSEYDEEFLFRE